MTLTQQYREKMGLSQKELAQYLGVSRSLLTFFEKGERLLPTAAMLKLIEIEKFLQVPVASKKNILRPHEKAQQLEANKQLNKLVAKHAQMHAQAKRKLEVVQKKYAQKLLLLELLDHLKTLNKNPAPNNPQHAAWLKMMDARAHADLEKNGLDKQVMLQVNISGLYQQTDQARLLLG